MKLLRLKQKNGIVGTAAYYALLLAVPVAIFLLTYFTQSPWPSLALMLLSKWRVVSVRPRYWYMNFVANAVDIIVGLGHVLFMYLALPNLWLMVALTIGYVVWLVAIKPRSSRMMVGAQGLTAVFVGVSALAFLAEDIGQTVYVLLMFVVGAASARHILTAYDEKYTRQLSLVWGVVLAEFGWIVYWWLFGYSLSKDANLQLVQSGVVATLLSFVSLKAYDSYAQHGKIRWQDILAPLLSAAVIIIVILLMYNEISVNQAL